MWPRKKAPQGGISIHALREEGDRIAQRQDDLAGYFYPRPPRGGRRSSRPKRCNSSRRISIHALREEGDAPATIGASRNSRFLSTPSARRATCASFSKTSRRCDFYPRPPRGGRHDFSGNGIFVAQFLSTPSARRATQRHCARPHCKGDFYPRPPRGGRQLHVVMELTNLKISIHALREEGDMPTAAKYRRPTPFLSTPSARRATPSWPKRWPTA